MKKLFLLLLVGVPAAVFAQREKRKQQWTSQRLLKEGHKFEDVHTPTTMMSGPVNGVPGSYWNSCSNCKKKNGYITCKQCLDHYESWTNRQTTIKIDSTKKLLNCNGTLTYDPTAYGCGPGHKPKIIQLS